MNLSMIAYIVGAVMEIEAGLMLLPALVGLIYGEKSALSFVICAAAAAIIGAIPILRKPKNTAIYAREGLCGNGPQLADPQRRGRGALLHDRPDPPLYQRPV